MSDTIHLFDCNNHVRRMFEVDKSGTALRNLINDAYYIQEPQFYIFDGKDAKARRRAIYSGYKVGRERAPDVFYHTLQMFYEMLLHTNKIIIKVNGAEADDVIATLVNTSPGQKFKIHSNDGDFRGLCNEDVTMAVDTLVAENPLEIRLYKALKGDPSDKIPGVKGFGQGAWDALTPEIKSEWVRLLNGEDLDINDLGLKPSSYDWLKDKANLELVRAFWKVVGFFDIPQDQLNSGTKYGVQNYPKIQALLKELFL